MSHGVKVRISRNVTLDVLINCFKQLYEGRISFRLGAETLGRSGTEHGSKAGADAGAIGWI